MQVSGTYEDILPAMLLLCMRQQTPSILFLLEVKRLSLWPLLSNTQKTRDPSTVSHTDILTELLWSIRCVQDSPAACLVELLGLGSQCP